MQDEVTVTLELRALVEAIINDYHTTRIGSDYVPHILSKPRTQNALAKFEQSIPHQAERETLARVEPVAWMYEREGQLKTPLIDRAKHMTEYGWTEYALGIIPTPPEAGQ